MLDNHQNIGKFISTINTILKRRCLISFSRLVLCDNVKQDQDYSRVRHYDTQCQAVEIISGLLNTKFKAIQLRAFHELKNFNDQAFNSSSMTNRTNRSRNLEYIRKTRRISTQIDYLSSPNIEINQQSQYKPTKNYMQSQSSRFYSNDNNFDEIPQKIIPEVRKFKQILHQRNKNKQSSSEYTSKDSTSDIANKRRRILQKVTMLQEKLSEFTTDVRQTRQANVRNWNQHKQLGQSNIQNQPVFNNYAKLPSFSKLNQTQNSDTKTYRITPGNNYNNYIIKNNNKNKKIVTVDRINKHKHYTIAY